MNYRECVFVLAAQLPEASRKNAHRYDGIASGGIFYAYSPYGQAVTLGPDEGNSLQYTGRENDGTGLYYYRARYYDPILKQFLSEDPIGIFGGVNRYTYVGGNPVSRVDPRGLYGVGIIGGGSAEAGLGFTGAGYQYSSGIGLFGIGNPDTELSVGGFTSEGGFVGGPNSGVNYPGGTPQSGNFVAGLSAGLGGGAFFTNAKCAKQLLGPFTTITVNLPFVSAGYAYDPVSRVVIGSILFGPPQGFSISKYTTTTTSASGCSCK